MNLFKKSFVLVTSLAVLAGCSSHSNLEDLSIYKQEFKESDANVFLKSFSDHRQGKALLKPEGSKIVYAYDPQTITSGQMLPLLGYYLYKSVDFRNDNAAKSIGIDVSVRNVETAIRHSSLPASRLGYYALDLQARVILRDMATNEIITMFPIVVSDTKLRNTTTGRAPSVQEDQYAMLDLFETVSIDLADVVLKETAHILEDYYELDNLEEILEETSVVEQQPVFIERAQEVKINEVKPTELDATADMIDYIESEEQKLLERKKAQRKLFEKKLEDQKYLDFLDKQQ